MNKEPTFFKFRGLDFPADGILGIKQVDERDVEVRYAGSAFILKDTTVEKVTAAVDAAKSKRR